VYSESPPAVFFFISSSLVLEKPRAGPPPEESGKIVFVSIRDGNFEIYIMNADRSDQHNISNNPDGGDLDPDWGPATETEP
jgi:hypothetical protein